MPTLPPIRPRGALSALILLACAPFGLVAAAEAQTTPIPPRRPPPSELAAPAARASARPAPVVPIAERLGGLPDGTDAPEPIRRPGALGKSPVAVPGEFLNGRAVAPRAGQPDLGVNLSDRTSVGVYGDVRQIAPEDIRTHGVKPTRDLEAGVSLQYKFGLD